MSSKGKIDIRMGGRFRDADETVLNVDGGSDALKQYLQDLFNNATFNWSQITGDITSNQDLINYLNSLIDTINQNNLVAGDLITNELKDYINNLMENLTVTWQQITGSPEFNQEFKDYIENLIDNLTINWEQITGSPVLNQTLVDLLNQYKTDITNSFADFVIDETVTNELKTYIDNLLTEIKNQLTEVTNATTLNQTLLTEIQNQIDEIEQTIEYITEGDTITQEYKDYIEQKFTTVEQTIQNITEGAVITEEIKQYIDDSLTELKTLLEQYIDNSLGDSITEIVNQITNNTTVKGEATRLISGTITWIQNLDFFVSTLEYQILNRKYTSPETLVTIPANAENNPRFAVIWADVFGNVGYILGAASAAPAVPHVNDSTQIALTTIYIPALGTAPSTDPNGETGTIETVVVYDENVEWQTAKTEETGVSIDLADTTAPAHGTKHISMTVAGGTSTAERSKVDTVRGYYQGWGYLHADANFTEMSLDMSVFWPDHKTDKTLDEIRHLIYYNFKNLAQVTVVIKDRSNLLSYEVEFVSSTYETWAIPEIGFSVNLPKILSFRLRWNANTLGVLPAGDYDVILAHVDRNDQQYNIIDSGSAFIEPAAALVSFTASEAVNIKDGSMSLSLKTSAPWLANTGIIFELYNAANKIGRLAMLPGNFYGFNPANPDYQRLTIPLADFAPTAAEITELVIRPVNSWPNSVLDIDYITIQTGVITPEQKVEVIEDMNFEYRDISDPGGIYTIDPAASFGYKVKEIVFHTNTGNATAALKINGSAITGLSAAAATNTNSTHAATGLNTLAKNDILTLEIGSVTNDATSLIGKVRYTRL